MKTALDKLETLLKDFADRSISFVRRHKVLVIIVSILILVLGWAFSEDEKENS